MHNIKNLYRKEFGICKEVYDLVHNSEKELEQIWSELYKTREFNQLKVIQAMQKNRLSDVHFSGTTGYGYDDSGREVLCSIYKDYFKTEDALVRHQIVSGTHALAICFFGILRPGDEFISVTGKPYDTLEELVGIRGCNNGSLSEFQIKYKQIEMVEGNINLEAIKNTVNSKTKLILIQRSRGYDQRPSVNISQIEQVIRFIKQIDEKIIVLVDNCYGEFVEKKEPTEVGADLVAGSLIKNPGGGLAPAGGYIAGKKGLVEQASYRMTAPGVGNSVGASLGLNRLLIQGFFVGPHVVCESLKGAVLCARVMETLGFETSPSYNAYRTDIIQAVNLNSQRNLIDFCQGIQKGSPVDSFVTPEPWNMPGYNLQVIMAAGSFIQGASIELSADAPVKPPYTAYVQGGLVYEHVKLGLMTALQKIL